MEDTQSSWRTSRTERTSYALYFFGQNLFYGLIALNMQTYYSDIGITASTVAVILLITKVWDAINDPLFGILIDKVRFKKGRFLPWLQISLPLIALSSIILFAIPYSSSPLVKILWASLAYAAWDMSYTLCDVPIFVLPTSMTDNIKERTSILASGRYTAVLGILLVMVVLPMLQKRLTWFVCGLIISVAGALIMIPVCITAKERHVVRPENEITMRQMFRYVAYNKYLLIFYLAMFIGNLTNFSQTLGIFFARYNFGNQDAATYIALVAYMPILITGALVPLITRRMDKMHLYLASQIAAAILGVIRYFAGYTNLLAFYLLCVLQGIFLGVNGILLFMFTPDCLEYGTFHTGERSEGIAASVQTFFTKLTGSITGPLAMLILAAYGFVSGENAIQPVSAIRGIWLCYTLLPSIGAALAVLLLFQYKLRDQDVQVMALYNNGEISKADADLQLASKYGEAAVLTAMNVTRQS